MGENNNPQIVKPGNGGQQRFVKLGEIGQGGFARVYEMLDNQTGKKVAMKVLAADLTQKQHIVERFKREIYTMSRIRHPNLVNIIEHGQVNGRPFYTMEFIDIVRPREIVDSFNDQKKLEIILQAADGLDACHTESVIHRDIKPDNILVDGNGIAKISDLGIVKDLLASEGADRTQTGMRMGSVHYMSPEQTNSPKDVDFRTDLYSLGASGYYYFTGRKPYDDIEGDLGHVKISAMEVASSDDPEYVRKHLRRFLPKKPSKWNPNVPKSIEALIQYMMYPTADGRYQSAKEVKANVARVLDGQDPMPPRARKRTPPRGRKVIVPIHKKPVFWLAAGGLAAAIGIGSIVALSGGMPSLDPVNQRYERILPLVESGKYDKAGSELESLAKSLNTEFRGFSNDPKVKELSLKIMNLAQKNKEFKDVVAEIEKFEQTYASLEANYDGKKHSELDALAGGIVSRLNVVDFKDEQKLVSGIRAKQDQAVTMKHEGLYAAVMNKAKKLVADSEEAAKAKFDFEKIQRLDARVSALKSELKNVDSKRVKVEEVSDMLADVNDDVKNLLRRDPTKKYGAAAEFYDAARRISKEANDKERLQPAYDKLKEAKAVLDKVPDKSDEEYRDMMNDLIRFEKQLETRTRYMPQLNLGFEDAKDADYISKQGQWNLEKGVLSGSGKLRFTNVDVLGLDVSGNFSLDLSGQKVSFADGRINGEESTYEARDVNYVKVENRNGKCQVYVNGKKALELSPKRTVDLEGRNIKIDNLLIYGG